MLLHQHDAVSEEILRVIAIASVVLAFPLARRPRSLASLRGS